MSAIDPDALEAAIRANDASVALQLYTWTYRDRDGCERFVGLPEEAIRLRNRGVHLVPLYTADDPDFGRNITSAFLASREEARQLRAEREKLRGIIARVEADLEGDFEKLKRLSPTFDQRDYGDETPDDDGFITTHPRPRRDGPGLDVKALADLEGRN